MASRRIIEEDSYETTPLASDTNTIPPCGQKTIESSAERLDIEAIDSKLEEEVLRRKIAQKKREVRPITCTKNHF